jgi:hypothetical protein
MFHVKHLRAPFAGKDFTLARGRISPLRAQYVTCAPTASVQPNSFTNSERSESVPAPHKSASLLRQKNDGLYMFVGAIGGVAMAAKITPQGGNIYTFQFAGAWL